MTELADEHSGTADAADEGSRAGSGRYDATFRIWRGDAAGGELQTFTVPVNEGEVVLDVIHRL